MNGYSFYQVDYQVPVVLFSANFGNFDMANTGNFAPQENAGLPPQAEAEVGLLNPAVHDDSNNSPVATQG